MKCPKCGKTKSNSGKEFCEFSLAHHIRDAHTKKTGWKIGDPTFEKTNMFADDDMPDGAFFAMAYEFGDL
jgi:hypothetical protein